MCVCVWGGGDRVCVWFGAANSSPQRSPPSRAVLSAWVQGKRCIALPNLVQPQSKDMGSHEKTAAPPLLVATQVRSDERRTQQRIAREGEHSAPLLPAPRLIAMATGLCVDRPRGVIAKPRGGQRSLFWGTADTTAT